MLHSICCICVFWDEDAVRICMARRMTSKRYDHTIFIVVTFITCIFFCGVGIVFEGFFYMQFNGTHFLPILYMMRIYYNYLRKPLESAHLHRIT